MIVGGLIGGVLGILAAYYRRLDGWIMRLVDVMLAFPAILIGLAVAAIFGAGLTAVVIALVVATVHEMADELVVTNPFAQAVLLGQSGA